MITLTYLSLVLELPNPQFPLSQNVNIKTTFEHDMAGRLHSYRYTPASDQFNLVIQSITHSKMREAEAFFILSHGQQIRYITETSLVYFGKITTETVKFTNTNKLAGEQFTYDFDVTFERTV